jgi:hypothetical protein
VFYRLLIAAGTVCLWLAASRLPRSVLVISGGWLYSRH